MLAGMSGGVLSYMQSVVYVFNKTCCITLQAVCKLWMQDNKWKVGKTHLKRGCVLELSLCSLKE